MLRILGLCACGALVLGVDRARCDDEKKDHAAVRPAPRDKDKAASEKHKSFVAQAKKGDIDLLLIGDALTDMWGGEGHDARLSRGLKVYEKELLALKAANFGVNGDKTQHVLWRVQNEELDGIKPKVVMLLIGTNNVFDNSAEEIADGVTAIVAEIKKKLPETKVLLLGIFPRGPKPNKERDKIKAANAILAKLDDGGKTVKFLDIGDKFVEADGTISKEVMYDPVHLTEKGYRIWADAVKGPIMELMKK
jgi:lysophospholipase L1-like esterase